MLGEESDDSTPPVPAVDETLDDMEPLLVHQVPREISINALAGSRSVNTIRLQGTLKGKKIHILIDSGSTHSFIDSKLVKQLGLVAEVVPPLLVSVADGSRIIVDSVCKNLQYQIQGHFFSDELRLFPLGSSDVILGVDWLKQYNPITFDHQALKITLLKDGMAVTLRGEVSEGSLHTISSKKLNKLPKSAKGVTQGFICMLQAEPLSTTSADSSFPEPLQAVLQDFKAVFAEPKGLPPV